MASQKSTELSEPLLDLCVIERMWRDDKHDYVQYYYNHPVRSASYTAYLPKGNLGQLSLKIGRMYRIRTAKPNRKVLLDSSHGTQTRDRSERSSWYEEDDRFVF